MDNKTWKLQKLITNGIKMVKIPSPCMLQE